MNSKWVAELFVALTLAITLGAAVSRADERLAPEAAPEIIEEFDIAKGGDVIVLPVTIGDEEYPFFLNIASPRTIVDSRLRPLLGKSLGKFDDESTPVRTEQFPALPMKIRSLPFTASAPVLCGDISDLRDYHGYDALGIIGLDFLKKRVVQIDFDQGKLRIVASFPDKRPDGAHLLALIKLPAEGSGSHLLDLNLPGPGTGALFKVDTLFPRSLAAGPTTMILLAEGRALAQMQPGCAVVSGVIRPGLRTGLIKSVSVGKWWTHTNLSITEARDDRVGLAYLSRFRLLFTFEEDAEYVCLAPGAKFDDPELFNWSGMELKLKDAKVVVMLVVPDSVAAKAGVETGDVILQLDGSDPRKFSMFEIRQFFMEQNLVQVKFQRPASGARPAKEFSVTLES